MCYFGLARNNMCASLIGKLEFTNRESIFLSTFDMIRVIPEDH